MTSNNQEKLLTFDSCSNDSSIDQYCWALTITPEQAAAARAVTTFELSENYILNMDALNKYEGRLVAYARGRAEDLVKQVQTESQDIEEKWWIDYIEQEMKDEECKKKWVAAALNNDWADLESAWRKKISFVDPTDYYA